MGYDVSFHPDLARRNTGMVFYSPNLDTAGTGREKVLALAAQHGIEDF
ncbi:MAG: hypothetical protein ACLUNQ_00650 [Oscillospiraceae bacterium]